MIGQKVSGGGNKVRGVITWGLVSWGIVAWSAGCSDGVGPETGTIRVLLTDAPSDVFSTAEVWVSHIYLQSGSTTDSGAGETAGRVDLFFDPENPQTHDLLLLQDGTTADLTGEVIVRGDTYHSLRMVVDSAFVTLKEGYTLANGDRHWCLKVPSGSPSGIKVQLSDGVLDLAGGEATTITVDFPVDDNFVVQVDEETGQIRQILFTPVLKELSRREAPA
jgi:hypothetical protein